MQIWEFNTDINAALNLADKTVVNRPELMIVSVHEQPKTLCGCLHET
jgi:hypothetical protein